MVSPTFFLKKGLLINLEKLRLDRDQLFVQRQNAFLEQEVDQHGSIIVAPADARPAPELNGEPEGILNIETWKTAHRFIDDKHIYIYINMMIFQNIKNGDFPSIATNKITGDLDEPVEHS